jgi:uncharacterized membrane protein
MAEHPSKGTDLRPQLLLGCCYPVAAHLAVLSGNPALIALSVGLLVCIALFDGLKSARPSSWMTLLATGIVLVTLTRRGLHTLPMLAPPVLITALMAWVFGQTLRPGRMPLIERIVRAIHGPDDALSPEILAYARRLTWAWSVLFTLLAATNLSLALFATPGGLLAAMGVAPPFSVPLRVWSLFANVINYLIIGGFFVLEYLLRRRRFPQQRYRSLLDFVRHVAGLGHLFRGSSASSVSGAQSHSHGHRSGNA